MITLVATSVTYFSQGDEDCFFSWLKTIECVAADVLASRGLWLMRFGVCVR